ncbi:MAG: TrkA family potassium uptake protein [Natronomonas sp.]
MQFVIVGAGVVGRRTARVLAEEDHEVVLVERDESEVDRLSADYEIVAGDGSDESTLLSVGVEDADGVAAVTGDLATNILVCMIANGHGCRTVLRVENDRREELLRRYATEVDEVIYPERLGAVVAKNALVGGNIKAVADVAQNLQLVQLTITPESPMNGYSLSELELPADSRVLAFGKGDDRLRLPEADASLETGDRIVAIADFDVLRDVQRIIVGDTEQAATAGGV